MYDTAYPVTVISAASEDWQCVIRTENQIFYHTHFASHLSPEVNLYIYEILENGNVKMKHIDLLCKCRILQLFRSEISS